MDKDDDAIWFDLHRDRQARIRSPNPFEFWTAWQQLGGHDASRRRVMVWRVPENNPGRRVIPDGLMRLPFLLRSDETIENADSVLLPILDDMMQDAMGKPSSGGLVETGVGAFPGYVQ